MQRPLSLSYLRFNMHQGISNLFNLHRSEEALRCHPQKVLDPMCGLGFHRGVPMSEKAEAKQSLGTHGGRPYIKNVAYMGTQ